MTLSPLYTHHDTCKGVTVPKQVNNQLMNTRLKSSVCWNMNLYTKPKVLHGHVTLHVFSHGFITQLLWLCLSFLHNMCPLWSVVCTLDRIGYLKIIQSNRRNILHVEICSQLSEIKQ